MAQRFRDVEKGLKDNSEALRIARIRYMAGATNMLTVLQLEERRLTSQATIIQLRNAQLANRINLHLSLGGSFNAATEAGE